MAEVRDIIKIKVAPEIVWQVLTRHVAAESGKIYEVDDHRALEARPLVDARKGYGPTSLGLLSHPEEKPLTWGELTMPILKRDYRVVVRKSDNLSINGLI